MVYERTSPRYILTERIGSGGTADVFRAEDTQLGRVVAFKRFHARFLEDEVLFARVEAEVALAGKLSHRGIVALYELARQGDDVGLVMEYLPAGDLRRRILARKRLAPEAVERIARSLLEALIYAHRRGIVHRDIKPRNVLFSEDNVPRLADFGLARSMSSAGLSEHDSVAGTAEYTAPETITASLWDARSDLYALGCTLFEALTGEPPFRANSPPQVLRMHVEEPVPDVSGLIPGDITHSHTALAILIATLLRKDPNERPQTAQEALRILEDDAVSVSVNRAADNAEARCPSCGAMMSPRYGWCFTCHKPNVPLVGSRRGGTTVFVTGPAARGEKLSPELRDACSEVAEALGLDALEVRKRVPRTPFVFARGLERGSALRLAAELEDRGVICALIGPGAASQWTGRKMILRKAMTMAPRIYLIFVGMSGGLTQFVTRMPPAISLAALGGILIGVPTIAALGYRRSTTRLVTADGSSSGSSLGELLTSVSDPLIHARVKNVVEAGGGLLDTVSADDATPAELRASVRDVVEQSIERAARLGIALNGLREGARYARHATMLSRGKGAEADTQASVAIVRQMDSLYTRTLEQIGTVALTIHETAVRLARSQEILTQRDLHDLEKSTGRLRDTSLGWQELEHELNEGA